MKATELIRAALTRLGVYATGEEVPADDAIPALRVLNELLGEYQLQPLMCLPKLYQIVNINDEVELPRNTRRVLILALALDIAPDYGIEPSNTLRQSHRNAMAALKLSNAVMIVKESDLSHVRGEGFYAED